MCYNAGTAALISDLPAALIRDLAKAEMSILSRNVSRFPLSPSVLLLPASRQLTLGYVSGAGSETAAVGVWGRG
jgi:hypothetical protein